MIHDPRMPTSKGRWPSATNLRLLLTFVDVKSYERLCTVPVGFYFRVLSSGTALPTVLWSCPVGGARRHAPVTRYDCTSNQRDCNVLSVLEANQHMS